MRFVLGFFVARLSLFHATCKHGLHRKYNKVKVKVYKVVHYTAQTMKPGETIQ